MPKTLTQVQARNGLARQLSFLRAFMAELERQRFEEVCRAVDVPSMLVMPVDEDNAQSIDLESLAQAIENVLVADGDESVALSRGRQER